jgi:hypothetical protein
MYYILYAAEYICTIFGFDFVNESEYSPAMHARAEAGFVCFMSVEIRPAPSKSTILYIISIHHSNMYIIKINPILDIVSGLRNPSTGQY